MSAKRFADEEVEAFCRHLAANGNQSAAVRHAFVDARDWPSDRSSKRAWKLLRRPSVKARIEELRGELGGPALSPSEPRRIPEGVSVQIELDDVEVLAKSVADPNLDARLRMILAKLVAAAVAELGRRARTASNATPVVTAVGAAEVSAARNAATEDPHEDD